MRWGQCEGGIGGRIWKKGGKKGLITPTHTHTHARTRTRTHAHSEIEAENFPKRKINPVPSKLISGQEVIAKDPNKKPTTGCKQL